VSALRRIPLHLLSLWLVLAATASAGADTIAFTLVNEFPSPSGAGGTTDGFQFTPTTGLQLTALGYYDQGKDGLTLVHPVTLFDFNTQTALASTNVGPGSFLDGTFRFNMVSPLLLQAGHTYLLAGFHPGGTQDPITAGLFSGGDAVPNPLIGYQGYFFQSGASLTFPTTGPDPDFFAFGPNLEFQAAIPEPASVVLAGVGIAGLTVWRWRRRGAAGCGTGTQP
jgi:hypothetical protein